MEDNKSKLAIVFATILLFVALVILIAFVVPRISELKSISNQVEAKRVEYETGKLKVMNAQELKKFVEQSRKQANTLGIAMPSSPSAEDALVELSSIASGQNLQVKSVEVQDDKKGNLFVSYSISGTFENSIGFLNKLKNNLRPIKIVDLSMSKTDNDITTNLDLDFPYYNASASATVSANPTQKQEVK